MTSSPAGSAQVPSTRAGTLQSSAVQQPGHGSGAADAVTLPWASGGVAVTFASGTVVTALTSIVMVLLSISLLPALQAFTLP